MPAKEVKPCFRAQGDEQQPPLHLPSLAALAPLPLPNHRMLRVDIQEVFDEMANHRNGDNPIGMTALTIKAMGDVLKEEPRLNARLFYSFFGRPRIAMYDHVSCSTVVARMNPAGEEVLLPLVVKNVDQLSIREVQAQLSDYKTQDLGALEAKTCGAKPKKLPAFIVKLLHYRFRTDPAFTEKNGWVDLCCFSSVIQTDTGLVAGNTPANQTALFPDGFDRPCCRL